MDLDAGGLTMASPTTVVEFLGDQVHTFLLPLKRSEELQIKLNAGPMTVLNRLVDGSWRIEDVTETIRLALIGGGMGPADAAQFISRYVDEQPLNEMLGAAVVILSATLNGRKVEDAGGNAKAAMSKSDPGQTGSTSPRSDGAPPSSGSARKSSAASRSRKSTKR